MCLDSGNDNITHQPLLDPTGKQGKTFNDQVAIVLAVRMRFHSFTFCRYGCCTGDCSGRAEGY